jgi:hypothetical protein
LEPFPFDATEWDDWGDVADPSNSRLIVPATGRYRVRWMIGGHDETGGYHGGYVGHYWYVDTALERNGGEAVVALNGGRGNIGTEDLGSLHSVNSHHDISGLMDAGDELVIHSIAVDMDDSGHTLTYWIGQAFDSVGYGGAPSGMCWLEIEES